MRSRLFLILIIFGFVGCKTLNPKLTFDELMATRSAKAKEVEGHATIKNCEHNSKKYSGKFFVNNNLWGKSKLHGKYALLCSYIDSIGVGWKWELPKTAKGVIGYPAIQVGDGPWHVKSKNNGFPIRLDSISTLVVNYEAEIYVKHKKYNLAYDLWLSSEFYSRPHSVTTEIMIWEDWFDFSSYGKKVESIETPFGTYDLYKGYLKNDEFGQDWAYFAFVRQRKRTMGEIDINYFLKHLISSYNVSPKQYLTSVEFGTEIGNSSGFAYIKEFDLQLNE